MVFPILLLADSTAILTNTTRPTGLVGRFIAEVAPANELGKLLGGFLFLLFV